MLTFLTALLAIKCHVASARPERPCDIYDAAKEHTPCVAAHSTVRALYGNYDGPLYQVRRMSDNTTKDIGLLEPGGYADSRLVETFCGRAPCVIWRIYDQTKYQNHLDIAPPGEHHEEEDSPCNATKDRLNVGGHPVYSAYFEGGMGYRNDKTRGVVTGDNPQSMYMVTSGKHYNNLCCFDYGNAETDNADDGAGTMEAVYFGNAKGKENHGGAGQGPWIMADMEKALWGADVVESNEEAISHQFVTAMVKGDASNQKPIPGPYTKGLNYEGYDLPPCGTNGCPLPKGSSPLECERKCNATAGCIGYVFADASCCHTASSICWTKAQMVNATQKACHDSRAMSAIPGHWAIKGGDAQNGPLKVYWDGKRAPGYAPMRKKGGIVLGIGGDNSAGAIGTFYEGVMTAGYSSDSTDNAVQANIVAAGYGT